MAQESWGEFEQPKHLHKTNHAKVNVSPSVRLGVNLFASQTAVMMVMARIETKRVASSLRELVLGVYPGI